jgi:hypothetical protein
MLPLGKVGPIKWRQLARGNIDVVVSRQSNGIIIEGYIRVGLFLVWFKSSLWNPLPIVLILIISIL